MLDAGQTAPDFTLPADTGETVTLSALRPAPVVVYFYPKDDTPGCTREAQDFTALAAEFRAAGARVFGISKDTVARHGRFRDKHGLGVTLLSDAEGDVCERFGTWTEQSMYGRKFMGIVRATYLIDGAGTIARVWPKVKVAGHAEDVLEAARNL